jgi:hypothetical protein
MDMNEQKLLNYLISLLLLLIVSPTLAITNQSNKKCIDKRTAAPLAKYRWHPASKIDLYFVEKDFDAKALIALRKALSNWQLALSQAGLTIRFNEIKSSISEDCDNCLIIKRDQSLKEKRVYGQFIGRRSKNGYITAATIKIDSNINSAKFLRRVLQHEIGHAFGLLDCYSCKSNSTVMQTSYRVSIYGIPINVWLNKMADPPSKCDIELIKEGYTLAPPEDFEGEELIISDGETSEGGIAATTPASTKSPEVGVGRIFIEKIDKSPTLLKDEEKALIDALIKREAEMRAALNNYTFTRNVLIQTIDDSGKVTGEYRRRSQMIFDDKGDRIEKVLEFPKPTLKKIKIVKEDLDDLSGSQLLGLELSDLNRYSISYIGIENIDNVPFHAFKITPADLVRSKMLGERVFYGTVWADIDSMQIVRLKGQTLPEGDMRFPLFETLRSKVDEKLLFPINTKADDLLSFKHFTVRMRMLISFTDYKKFKSELRIIDDEEIPQKED